jgi:hypothetical protein
MSKDEVNHAEELKKFIDSEIAFFKELKESYQEEALVMKEIEQDERESEAALSLPVEQARGVFTRILQKYLPNTKITG